MVRPVAEYVFDTSLPIEAQRLALLQELFDPLTVRQLEARGVAEGWRCLEVGAGPGSIARWLAARVGLSGTVLATDLDTRFLGELGMANVEVRRHDVVRDPLPKAEFDLVHARFLLEHVPERDEVIPRLVEALKPGGWIVLTDLDGSTVRERRPRRHFDRVMRATNALYAAAGWDPTFGARLPDALTQAGLEDVGAEGIQFYVRGATAAARFFWLMRFQLRERLVATGLTSERDIDRYLADLEDPSWGFFDATKWTAWGTRSAACSRG
jgi:SAM-dependent methyltransferase